MWLQEILKKTLGSQIFRSHLEVDDQFRKTISLESRLFLLNICFAEVLLLKNSMK